LDLTKSGSLALIYPHFPGVSFTPLLWLRICLLNNRLIFCFSINRRGQPLDLDPTAHAPPSFLSLSSSSFLLRRAAAPIDARRRQGECRPRCHLLPRLRRPPPPSSSTSRR
jgi:hypothetical protein